MSTLAVFTRVPMAATLFLKCQPRGNLDSCFLCDDLTFKLTTQFLSSFLAGVANLPVSLDSPLQEDCTSHAMFRHLASN